MAFQTGEEIKRLRSELETEREAHKWIPVSERMPDKSKHVLLLKHTDEQGVGRFLGNCFSLEGGLLSISQVTHWQPLPEPPKE
jgi:hypothetical protein